MSAGGEAPIYAYTGEPDLHDYLKAIGAGGILRQPTNRPSDKVIAADQTVLRIKTREGVARRGSDVLDFKNCACDLCFYVAAAILLEGLLLGVVYLKGGIAYAINFKFWAIVFGAIWLGSFALTWRFLMVPHLAKFPLPPR